MPHSKNHSDKVISDGQRKSVEIFYQEGIRVHLYNVEWRHKIVLRFFISSAALLIVAGWLWKREISIPGLFILPLLIAAIMSTGYF